MSILAFNSTTQLQYKTYYQVSVQRLLYEIVCHSLSHSLGVSHSHLVTHSFSRSRLNFFIFWPLTLNNNVFRNWNLHCSYFLSVYLSYCLIVCLIFIIFVYLSLFFASNFLICQLLRSSNSMFLFVLSQLFVHCPLFIAHQMQNYCS